MNLSPWFKPTDPPVRMGKYEVKDYAGRIADCEWDGREFIFCLSGLPFRTVYRWRGVVA